MVIEATNKEVEILAKLAAELWAGHSVTDLQTEFSQILSQKDAAFFIKLIDDIPIGFAQCQLRHDYVEGTSSSPVGYLEGIYVQDKHQGNGYSRELLEAAEFWAENLGCTEFASDCELDNNQSLNFHLHTGFEEVNRIICFRKKL